MKFHSQQSTFIVGCFPMADNNNSFDCSESDLLCNEETKGLCFNGDSFKDQRYDNNGDSDSPLFIHFPGFSEECIDWMLEREREHLPRDDYLSRMKNGELDFSLREEALDWMFKVCDYYNFNELSLYTAVSYFDRFLSMNDVPVSSLRGETWAIQLVAVACLSLATKIEEVNVPLTVDLQAGEPKYLFEGNTIQRMEILVLKGLNWNIKAYTPYNFIDYYLREINNRELPLETLITTSVQIIKTTTKGIDFLEFRPSEIGAAVAIFVSGEMQTMDIDKALSSFKGVDKGRVVKCFELVQDMAIINGSCFSSCSAPTSVANSDTDSAPNSRNGVSETSCLSNKSDENGSPETKRRKVNHTTLNGDS